MCSFFVALSIKEFYASTHSRPCYFASKDKISWSEKIICDCWIYSGVWEVEACALQDYIARRSEIAARESFHRMMKLFMICALWCFVKSVFPSLIHFFMSNEERSGVQKKKPLLSFCDIIQMREMNSCKNFSNQVWKLISKSQVKFGGGCYHRRCQQ